MPHRAVLLLSLLPCLGTLHCGAAATGGTTTPGPTESATNPEETSSSVVVVGAPDPEDIGPLFERGMQLLHAGRCADAIAQSFDPIVASFEARYGDTAPTVVCARDPGAGLLQGLLAAADERDAVILGPDWPDALYFRAFCQVELGDAEQAKQSLLRALQLLPDDVLYLSELGHVYQMERDWPRAMQIYRQTLAAAERLLQATESAGAEGGEPPVSPGSFTPLEWVGRALRGLGYTLVELGELDEAERQYRRALELNPDDQQAVRELEFIAERRATGAP